MKRIIITIIALFCYISVVNGQSKDKLEQISDNYFAYTENSINDDIHQTGFYILVKGELLRDGEWKHYINGKLISKAKYSKDKLVLLIIDGVEYSDEDLQVLKLGHKDKGLATAAVQ